MLDAAVRTILVATDLSDGSDDVVRIAADVAGEVGAELHVVHAMEEHRRSLADLGFDLIGLRTFVKDARGALEDQVGRVVPADVRVGSSKVEYGVAPAAICRRAKEVGAGLIVVGHHRTRFPGSHRLGTTARKVVQEARVPVLVGRGSLAWPPEKILLPVGRDDVRQGLLHTAAAWIAAQRSRRASASAERSDVRVLHVVRSADDWRDFSVPFAQAVRAAGEHPEIHADLRLRRAVAWNSSAADEIARLAVDTGTNLIAMGVCGKGPLLHAVLGSVAAEVLEQSAVPVLLFPPHVCERGARPGRVIQFPAQIGIR